MSGRDLIVRDSAGTRSLRLESLLDADALELAEARANAWIKTLRHVRIDGLPLRDRFTYHGDSLWWFAELYLHKGGVVTRSFRTMAALTRLFEQHDPMRVQVTSADPVVIALTQQAARQHGARCRTPSLPWTRRRVRVATALKAGFHTAAAVADRLRPGAVRRRMQSARVAGVLHAAFWRDQDEAYLGPVLEMLRRDLSRPELALVGVGPRTNFRARRWQHRLAEFRDPSARDTPWYPIEGFTSLVALRSSARYYRDRHRVRHLLGQCAELRGAAVVDGYDLWPALWPELAGIAELQFPWSARAMDEAGAMLDVLRPSVVFTYAEAGGWGRALVLEARRRKIPSVGLQHGFIYRHWLNYRHEPDELQPSPRNPADRGFPHPTLTLVFDGLAAEHLTTHSQFPPTAVRIVGSPRLDALVARFREIGGERRALLRERLRAENRRVIVLAAKHAQLGPAYRALLDAVAAIAGAHLVIKPHPGEDATVYEGDLPAARGRAVLAPPDLDLAELLAAGEALATVNSTAAIEAMVLGIPSVIVRRPSNLTPFVDAGVMIGADRPAELAGAVRTLLYDEERRRRIFERQQHFMQERAIRPDGLAARRAADAILELARAGSPE